MVLRETHGDRHKTQNARRAAAGRIMSVRHGLTGSRLPRLRAANASLACSHCIPCVNRCPPVQRITGDGSLQCLPGMDVSSGNCVEILFRLMMPLPYLTVVVAPAIIKPMLFQNFGQTILSVVIRGFISARPCRIAPGDRST